MASPGLLGDTPDRDYGRKLRLFNDYAEAELRQAIASLTLTAGSRVLDAGCGSGEALNWLREATEPDGTVVGIDLAAAHTRLARARADAGTLVAQADVLKVPLREASVDLIWSVNTLNHLHDAVPALEQLASLLRPGGRIALGQSSLLADMYFAWDARLEQAVNEAVRRHYRERYGLEERDLTAVRSLVGNLRRARLRDVRARTFMIERVSPLTPKDEAYLLETIFENTWGQRVRAYLSEQDYQELSRLCDPRHPGFALRRPDFHFLQSFTLVVGHL
jgi:SAM-dependent methyltransferase